MSITENLGLMGVPMPGFLKNMLEAMRDKSDIGRANKD
ncbi:Toxin secretion/phage lysis holin (fragment) [uncultured Eubacteriales bacterium]|uniref:Toxin secretion/phage lysis holin n=1 Tax=uncultured Eubacteriales bacterium TaxID=172733 RepID=A0A212JTL4_9FIRM